ncbi:MAG: hypothetical protein A2460_05760 [Omnitrophica WOR_2 bacterium RIFOXYC2_FULL_43_9]|nr:MAG: hypothetical protein A2460_05760 [Omnitrophica WOR_2 bacterium RIFOXYC2_FULL_43_9]
MKIKVCIVIDNLYAGGTQRQLLEFLKSCDRQRFNITVISLDGQRNPMEADIVSLGYSVLRVSHKGFFNLTTIFSLCRIFKSEKPDIVHTYPYTSDFYGRLAAIFSNITAIICSVRNIQIWKKWYHLLADKILSSFTDTITVNAENIKPYLIKRAGINPDKIRTIYNGKDLSRFAHLRDADEMKRELRIPQNSCVVGMVGRFSEQKDYPTFLKAAKKVSQSLPDTYFAAIGDGQTKQEMRDLALRLGLSGHTIFTGLRNDVPDLINTLDIGVLVSHYEGCPNVILEYMAGSKPTIAADVGGCAEVIEDGKTGFIVAPRDTEALAEKIITLLKDTSMRARMGEAGRKRVEECFSLKKMVQSTENLYTELYQQKYSH